MEKYSLTHRALHWSMAIIILILIGVGWYMQDLDKSVSYRNSLYFWHKSFGALILALLLARLISRVGFGIPPLPKGISPLNQRFAHFVHVLLYYLMIAVPLSGYLMSNAFGHGVSFFGLELPFLWEKNIEQGKFFRWVHGIAPYVLLGLVVLHVAGVIKHRFFDKKENDVLRRML